MPTMRVFMTIQRHSLCVHALKKSFGSDSMRVDVIKGITITFKQGTTYAITGISGSGKTTFMHLLAGLDEPDEGTILLDNRDIATFNQAQREHFLNQTVGLVFQFPYLINELTVLENVALKGFIADMERSAAQQQARTLLKNMGLADKAYAYPAQLSGGQQQRVALARALFNKPVFLLADEPTASLDRNMGKEIIDLLLDYQRAWGMGIIMSSHDPYIATVVDHVVSMHDGILL
jgi:ABC-type lipoprotein export system ATPase subunit